MTMDPFWFAILGLLAAAAFLFVYWRVLEHGWKGDIERERLMREEWERIHPAE